MRSILAALSSAAVALGVLVGVAAPARAADLGTVTVSYSSFVYSVTPQTLSGAVGDTFTLANTLTSGNDSASFYVSLMNDSGAVSLNGVSCLLSTDCQIRDLLNGTASGIFDVASTGSVKVMRVYNGGSASQIGTITIGGSSGSTDPALVYPTLDLNPNGGTCTGTMQFIKSNGQNGTVTLPTGSTCTRTGYALRGWARSADATSPDPDVGSAVSIGDESFMLYAVWAPTGSVITYDANVGADATCVDASGANVPAGDGRMSTVLNPTTFATAAPCSPDNSQLVLAGWATAGNGPVTYRLGDSIALAAGTRVHLYAVWQPTLTVNCPEGRGALPLFTFTCTDFGQVPVGWRAILEVRVTNNANRPRVMGALPLASAAVGNGSLEQVSQSGDCSDTVTVPAGGSCTLHYAWRPSVAGALSPEVPVTVCAGSSNQCYRTASGEGLRGTAYAPDAQVPVAQKPIAQTPVAKTIVITGERVTVSGKTGIRVDGVATGFSAGDTVVPWLRFPGQTEYVQGSARPVINEDGEVRWERKTGKKAYVYLTNDDGSVTSNRIIIQAR